MPSARIPIEQTFFGFTVAVTNVAVPIAPNLDVSSMIDSFFICNFSTNANSVFFGDQNVTITTGIEILTSSTIQFVIQQERQFYELQEPAIGAVETIGLLGGCQVHSNPIMIPIKVWRLANCFLIASVAGPTNVSVLALRNV